MPKPRLPQLVILAALLLAACDAGNGPLIKRNALFGAPERYQLRLSPDGKEMSFLAPTDGVLNIWIAPRGDFEAARPLTNDRRQGIGHHLWAPNGRTILYRQDRTGTQNWRIYALDIATGRENDLTPFEGVQASILGLSNEYPDDILLTLNRRDPRFADVYRANLKSGEVKLVVKNPGFSSFVADNDLNVRFALAPTPDGGMTIFEARESVWRKAGAIPPEDVLSSRLLDFDRTNKRIYMIDSRGRDTAALTRFTLTTGETEILGQDDKADIASVFVQPETRVIQAFTVNYQRRQWRVIDPSIEPDLNALSTAAGSDGEFEIVDRTRDDRAWVVHIDKVVEPNAYYLYERGTQALKLLFSTNPALKTAPLVPMHSEVIRARDGLPLVVYYSLPRNAALKANGKPARRSPLVVIVHGGPWSRDKYGFDEWHQWLANRGYAVLNVNFRGSLGFGKAFVNAADRQWGGAMLGDIEDAAEWSVERGIAERAKIAIVGGQFGGYAALSSLAVAPERYACGISIGGPSNLVNFLTQMPLYWTSIKDILRRRIGDPSTSEGAKALEAQSPAFKAAQIARPLLVVQGANDPEVSESDTQAIVRSLKERGVPVTYVFFPDEGSHLARPVNQMSFYAIAEGFLGKCLGGKTEPIADALKGSSAQIVEGTDYVPGLVEAMAQANAPAKH